MAGFRPPRSILVVGTPQRAAFADVMLSALHDGLRRNGEDAHLLLMTETADLDGVKARAVALAAEGRAVFQVDLNAAFNVAPSPDYPIRHRFNLLLDHPFFHLHKYGAYLHPMTIGLVDRCHIPVFADCGIDWPVAFVPHAGPEPDPAAPNPPMGERDIDLLFCANLSPMIFEPVFRQYMEPLPEPCRPVVIEAINAVMGQGLDVHAALRQACGRRSDPPFAGFALSDLRRMVELIEGVIVGIQRRDVVEGLLRTRGVAIHLVGNIPDILDLSRFDVSPDVTVHGSLPFDRVSDMMARSKVVLNANFSILGGSHERIWQAMAMGCVVLTNESGFMREQFPDGLGAFFLPPDPATLPEILPGLLADRERLAGVAAWASAAYLRDHTWAKRVRSIIEVFDRVMDGS